MYVVLQDEDAQKRADERRHDQLMKQDERIREVFRKRLGAMSERQPRFRRQFYEQHQPVFVSVNAGAVETVTLDEFLEAVDDEEKRAVLMAKWEGIIPILLDATPPEGQPQMGDIDPATGQQAVIDPGAPNFDLKFQLWSSLRERVLTQGLQNTVPDMACLLTPFYRERFTYWPARVVKELRDMRKLMKDEEPAAAPVRAEEYA